MKELTAPVELIRRAWKIFFEKEKMIYLFKIYSVLFVLSAVSYIYTYFIGLQGYTQDEYLTQVVVGNVLISSYVIGWSIVSSVLGLWVQASTYEAVKRTVNGGIYEFKDTYKTSWKFVWKFLLLGILIGLSILGGLVLLIIPALIFGTWFSFSNWNLVDRKMGIIESMKESKALVKGRFWKVFWRLLVFGVFAILIQTVFLLIPYRIGSVAITVFGGLFLLPYFLLYQELVLHKS